MSKPFAIAIFLITLVIPVSACGPAATPVPSTDTVVSPSPIVALSPVPPMATATQASTPTPVPLGGGLIAFYSERDGNAEIYTIHADGSAETRLTQNLALDIAPDISPDGSQIVFVSDRDGNEEIYRMNGDGSNVVRLTTAPAKDSYPFWSADGTKIIFCSQRDDGHTYEVYLMNSDGTDPTRITNNAVSEEWAYLSPDMQKIVYSVGPFPDYTLWVMNVDGSDPHQVFSSDKSAAFPKWSRDGRRIAFNHAVFSSGEIIGDICLVDQDGSNFRQMTTTGGDSVSEGAYWSPDGSRIVFQSNRTGNFQIYVMNADGSNLLRLTNHHGNDYYPSWGPAATAVPPTAVPILVPTPAAVTPSALFLPGPEVLEGAATFQIGLGDLDGDGDLDAVFANMETDSQVWLNDGTGNFSPTGQRLTEQGHGVGMGDLDGDGDLDLFITCAGRGDSDKRSTVYLNDGAANFSAGQSLGDLKPSGNSIELADIDGDGDLDACIQYYELPYRVYWNDGHGTFSQSEVEFSSDLELAWGDLDADGDVDIFAKELGKGYKTLLNDGAGHFQNAWQMPGDAVEYGYHSVALGDLDGDGDLDAFVTNGSLEASDPAQVFLNDGTGQFSANGQTLPGVTKSWVELGDLDGDEDLDAFLVIIRGPSQVWTNDGKGFFSDSGLRLGGDSSARGCALGDLEGDGDIDVFVSAFFGGPNRIWHNMTVP